MRISVWSSDVCSSDLLIQLQHARQHECVSDADVGNAKSIADQIFVTLQRALHELQAIEIDHAIVRDDRRLAAGLGFKKGVAQHRCQRCRQRRFRSEERREGKEWVSTCRSTVSPYHSKKKKTNPKTAN